MGRVVFVLFVLFANILNSQEKIREKFDFELYEKLIKEQKNEDYELPNGNIIWRMKYLKQEGIYSRIELVNEYPYYTLYKEYYKDGYLKLSKKTVGDYTYIGQRLMYDKKGNLTVIDEDKKFGKIKIDYIMNFLQENGIIDLKTGEGWYDKKNAYSSTYFLYFEEDKIGKYWIISYLRYERLDPENPKLKYREEPAHISFMWLIDGETGEVYTENEIEKFDHRNQPSNTTRTFQGKTYTEEEWKAFEQDPWEKYQAKSRIRRTFGSGCLDK